jgi:hypothetical protein
MVPNILVLVGIILIVVVVVAYNSKRQIVSDYRDDAPVDETDAVSIVSENVADMPASGSIEHTKDNI